VGTPFLGEIKIVPFNFAPKGWTFCNGSLLPINQNQALFALLGTTYGGNGITTFALPNLQGATPVHIGNGIVQGQTGGETSHTLTTAELASHTHTAVATPDAASSPLPAGNVWAQTGVPAYGPAPNTSMTPPSIATVGGNQPHENTSPYLVLNFIIALQGIFPSRN
jgi:microcystin-dependent protein